MARPNKQGLDYFPFEIDLFSDLKVRKLIKYQGGKAVTVYTLLLCNIYKEGYYMRWDEELPFMMSEQTGFEEAYIREVIRCCMVVGLIAKDLFDSDKVLTSKGIQERYATICKVAKRKFVISEFNLINPEEIRVNSEETMVNSEETIINSEFSTQRKEKERKEKERIEKENINPLLFPLDEIQPENAESPIAPSDAEKRKSSAKKKKDTKHVYGQYANVLLTDKEYAKLMQNSEGSEIIEYFSAKKEMKGYKYNSDYLAILNWGIKSYHKEHENELTVNQTGSGGHANTPLRNDAANKRAERANLNEMALRLLQESSPEDGG